MEDKKPIEEQFEFQFIANIADILRSKGATADDGDISIGIDLLKIAPVLDDYDTTLDSAIDNLSMCQAYDNEDGKTVRVPIFKQIHVHEKEKHLHTTINSEAIPWLLEFSKK